MKLEQIELAINGMNVHIIPTKKFKTMTLFLQLKAPLHQDTNTKRALLSYVLKSATEKYPTSKALRQRLDDLYGASLHTFLSKKGNFHIMSIRMETANERFLKSSSALLQEVLLMLGDVLLHPLVKNNGFDPDVLRKEKRTLIQRIQSVNDDKMRYASQRLIDEMCKDERYHLHTYGYKEDLSEINEVSLYNYYQDMLQNDEIDLYIVGDLEEEDIKPLVEKTLPLPRRSRSTHHYDPFESIHAKEVNIVKEAQTIEQGKLNLGYRTNVVIGDKDYFASQVFNGLFGGFPHSKLFKNVREKANLAYYAVSRYESYKGLMLVMTGIESKNYDQAVSITNDQLKNVQVGQFTEEEIEQTKALLKNSVLESMDNPNAIVDFLYNGVLSQGEIKVDDWLDHIDKVTRDDIIQVAKKTELDTIYFLHGQEGQ